MNKTKSNKQEQEEEEVKIPKPQEPVSAAVEELGDFPSYQQWLLDLGDWTTPLKSFLSQNTLPKLHEFVKKEMKTETVSDGLCRRIMWCFCVDLSST